MKRLLIVLVASLVLGLVGGVGSALASDLIPLPSDGAVTSQTATQSNDGTNSANQTGTSAPIVVSGPNIAVANGGSSCNPCDGGGTTTQNSGNNVDASNTNTATQTNNQGNGAGQTQTVGPASSGSASQSADQSNEGSNSANQSGTSEPVVVSGPNVAVLNSGDVNQNSGNNVDASNENNATQTNNQSNGAGQSQTVAGSNGCCSSGEASQSASQSNQGSNSANQSGRSYPVVVSGGNYAIANKGDVNQNSGNNVDASNTNTANQRNNQSNSAGQSQTVAGTSGCCHSGGASQSADQSNSGYNSANQSGTSAPVVVSGPNFAIGNGWGHDACNPCAPAGGDVHQNSGNNVDASNSSTATQVNNQGNGLGQTQTVWNTPGHCCSGGGDVTQSAHQSNQGSNYANQSGRSYPVVVSGGNYALLNKGGVTQNSGNNVDASNTNTATQVNNQGNGLGQTQTVWNSPGGCCSGAGDVTQSAQQSNRGENSANQTGVSSPVVVSGSNVAFLNHGGIHQNSGNNVDASNTNTATQSNNQSNSLGQTQTVDRGGCCPHPCEPQCPPEPCEPECPPEPCEPECPPEPCEPECPPEPCEPRCEPKPCEPCEPRCEPRPCEPNEHEPKSNSGRGNLSETGTGTRQSNSSTLKNPHEGERGPGDYPTGDRDPGNSGPQNRGGD